MKFKIPNTLFWIICISTCLISSSYGEKKPLNPAQIIEASEEATVSCTFSMLPWLTGQRFHYDGKLERMVLAPAPEMPQLYYPHNGKMIALKLHFQSTSEQYLYTGPKGLIFYLRETTNIPDEQIHWKPAVLSKLEPTSKNNFIILDFKHTQNGIAQGIVMKSAPSDTPPGSMIFVNASNMPVIALSGETKNKVPPYGQFLYRFKSKTRERLTVKAATIIDEQPKIVLNRTFVMPPEKRILYIIFPTDDTLKIWRTKTLSLNSIRPVSKAEE